LVRDLTDNLEKIKLQDAANYFGIFFEHHDQYHLAEYMFQKVLNGRMITLGKEHPDTLTSMNNLAFLLESQGKCDGLNHSNGSKCSRRITVIELDTELERLEAVSVYVLPKEC